MNGKASLNIDVYNEYAASVWLLPVSINRLKKMLALMLEASQICGVALGGVELHVTDDASVAAVNRQYLGCAGPTNIISFPGGDDSPGILILSADTYARECMLYGQDKFTHLARLLAHGFGHLAGYDHGEAMDLVCDACIKAVMENRSCQT